MFLVTFCNSLCVSNCSAIAGPVTTNAVISAVRNISINAKPLVNMLISQRVMRFIADIDIGINELLSQERIPVFELL